MRDGQSHDPGQVALWEGAYLQRLMNKHGGELGESCMCIKEEDL